MQAAVSMFVPYPEAITFSVHLFESVCLSLMMDIKSVCSHHMSTPAT